MRIRRLVWVLCVVAASESGCFLAVGPPEDGFVPSPDGGLPIDPYHQDGGGGPGQPGCPAVSCSSYGDVETLESLVGIIYLQPWTTVAKATSACLSASNDVNVTRTINLRSSDVILPNQCLVSGACAGLTFRLAEGAQGVTCLDQFCTALMLNGSHFRVRLLVRDQYPARPRYVPVMEVLPRCDASCQSDELTCSVNHTCWADKVETCRFCQSAPQEKCACVDKLEGDPCLLYKTNDMTCSGACVAGRCVLDPGQKNCP